MKRAPKICIIAGCQGGTHRESTRYCSPQCRVIYICCDYINKTTYKCGGDEVIRAKNMNMIRGENCSVMVVLLLVDPVIIND